MGFAEKVNSLPRDDQGKILPSDAKEVQLGHHAAAASSNGVPTEIKATVQAQREVFQTVGITNAVNSK